MGACASDAKMVMRYPIYIKQPSNHNIHPTGTPKDIAKPSSVQFQGRKFSKGQIMDQINILFRRFDQNCSGFLEEAQVRKMLVYLQGILQTGQQVTADKVSFLLQHTSEPELGRISRQDVLNFYLTKGQQQSC